jgi:hypothetical protein
VITLPSVLLCVLFSRACFTDCVAFLQERKKREAAEAAKAAKREARLEAARIRAEAAALRPKIGPSSRSPHSKPTPSASVHAAMAGPSKAPAPSLPTMPIITPSPDVGAAQLPVPAVAPSAFLRPGSDSVLVEIPLTQPDSRYRAPTLAVYLSAFLDPCPFTLLRGL